MSSKTHRRIFALLAERVEACMQNHARQNRTILEKGLYGVSKIYQTGVRLQAGRCFQALRGVGRLPCRVISVGNLTVGGSGKTPMTIYLARMLRDAGYAPAVISRGYKGRREKAGGIVSDGRDILLGPEDAGDEPFMMATQLRHIPFLVGADRYGMGQTAVAKFHPDVVILDDGFQHRRLYRDIDFCLVDATVGFGNGFLLPRGILREPRDALSRADAVVLTRSDKSDAAIEAEINHALPYMPVFRSVNHPFVFGRVKANETMPRMISPASDVEGLELFKNARVLGFSGIARSYEFKRMIRESAGQLVDFLDFPDHYQYNLADWYRISTCVADLSVDYLVTTQKDYVRIQAEMKSPVDLIVVGIQMDFGGDGRVLMDYIHRILSASHSKQQKGRS